jgi:hypothetical protein
MDVDSLRNELEKHLANNPDAHAPHGFRDRFNIAVEQYEAGGEGIPKEALEAELQQIRVEAEAAARAAGTEGDAPAQPHAEAVQDAVVAPEAPAEPIAVAPAAPVVASSPAPSADHGDPAPGGFARYGVPLIVALIVMAAAWYFFFRH